MNRRTRRLLISIFCAVLTTVLAHVDEAKAQTGNAHMVSCEGGQSVSGAWGYIGTYRTTTGAVFRLWFPRYCPYSVAA
jgi:hypothetical protein